MTEEYRHEFDFPEEEELPPFELEEPLTSAEPTAKDYDVLMGPKQGMIPVDDFHLRNVALSLAHNNDTPERVIARAKAYLGFLQGE